MTSIKAIITALIVSAAALQLPAYAEDSIEFAVKPNRGLDAVQHRRLDTLFDALSRAKSEVEALGHEREIWRIWTDPTDTDLRGKMDKAIESIEQKDYAKSIILLDDIIDKHPKYAEAWNQRALVHFQLENFDESLSDIAATLKLEPRHFGALSGRGIIHYERGEKKLAEQAILRAMRYHPYVRSRSLLMDVPTIPTSEANFI